MSARSKSRPIIVCDCEPSPWPIFTMSPCVDMTEIYFWGPDEDYRWETDVTCDTNLPRAEITGKCPGCKTQFVIVVGFDYIEASMPSFHRRFYISRYEEQSGRDYKFWNEEHWNNTAGEGVMIALERILYSCYLSPDPSVTFERGILRFATPDEFHRFEYNVPLPIPSGTELLKRLHVTHKTPQRHRFASACETLRRHLSLHCDVEIRDGYSPEEAAERFIHDYPETRQHYPDWSQFETEDDFATATDAINTYVREKFRVDVIIQPSAY